ncbi:MAG: hypothetical protein AABY22_06815 [Nanoarchaeota archaeon]
MDDKRKKLLVQIFCTKGGWLAISLFFVLIFGVLANWFEWAYLASAISFIYPAILGLTLIVFALFINPIKNRKKKSDE